MFELVQSVASTPAIHPLPTSLVEELFNATFRYFPIRFKKASADLGAVSSEALALKLRDALFSSTIFAPFLFMGLSQRIVGEDEDDDVIAALQVIATPCCCTLALHARAVSQPELQSVSSQRAG